MPYRIDFERRERREPEPESWIESRTIVTKYPGETFDRIVAELAASPLGVAAFCILALVALFALVR